jgi:hypothetical protein
MKEQMCSSNMPTRSNLSKEDGHTMLISEKPTVDQEQECLNMFNRAVEYNDCAAWQFLNEHFSGVMHYWLRKWFPHEDRYCLESDENCIDLAFERFWYAASYKQHIHFDTLVAALSYLQASLRSVAIDIIRTHKRNDILSIEHLRLSETFVKESDDEVLGLWEEIEKVLSNEREKRAAYLLFNCNLKPRQVVQLCPQEFDDVQELYQVRKKVFDRFVSNADTLRWRLQG